MTLNINLICPTTKLLALTCKKINIAANLISENDFLLNYKN